MAELQNCQMFRPDSPEDIAREIFGEHFIQMSGTMSTVESMYIETKRIYRVHPRAWKKMGYRLEWVRPDAKDDMTVKLVKD